MMGRPFGYSRTDDCAPPGRTSAARNEDGAPLTAVRCPVAPGRRRANSWPNSGAVEQPAGGYEVRARPAGFDAPAQPGATTGRSLEPRPRYTDRQSCAFTRTSGDARFFSRRLGGWQGRRAGGQGLSPRSEEPRTPTEGSAPGWTDSAPRASGLRAWTQGPAHRPPPLPHDRQARTGTLQTADRPRPGVRPVHRRQGREAAFAEAGEDGLLDQRAFTGPQGRR